MRNSFVPKIFLVASVWLLAPSAPGQNAGDPEIQSWNDLQVTIPLDKHHDIFTVGTLQFGRRLTNVDNTRFAVGLNRKFSKNVSVAPFVTFLSDRNSAERFRYEYRYAIRAVFKKEFRHFAISHRSQAEYRIRPGRNTWRYRPSITFEKPFPETLVSGMKLFITEEPFYDSASGRFSRNRLSAGINKKINEKFSVDVYYLYQGDNFNRSSSMKVIGTSWKVSL